MYLNSRCIIFHVYQALTEHVEFHCQSWLFSFQSTFDASSIFSQVVGLTSFHVVSYQNLACSIAFRSASFLDSVHNLKARINRSRVSQGIRNLLSVPPYLSVALQPRLQSSYHQCSPESLRMSKKQLLLSALSVTSTRVLAAESRSLLRTIVVLTNARLDRRPCLSESFCTAVACQSGNAFLTWALSGTLITRSSRRSHWMTQTSWWRKAQYSEKQISFKLTKISSRKTNETACIIKLICYH